jgi:2-methylfumaryl-CoA hydratase
MVPKEIEPMAVTFSLTAQRELAPGTPVDLARVRAPQYGRYLDDLAPGQVYAHPRGLTIDHGLARAFATTFHQANPLYLNEPYAKAHGFPRLPASPQLVFNVVLSLGVQNDSEKAMANLGYYDARFLAPVLAGDTLRAFTKVIDRKERGPGKPGIVTIRTVGVNQDAAVVLQYERKIMVMPRGDRPPPTSSPAAAPVFPWVDSPTVTLPAVLRPDVPPLTSANTCFEDFAPGDVIVHANGRTVTDEHVAWTYGVGNTHPLHYDRVYSGSLSGAMSGEPIVYGGLVFAWLEGLASRDVTENALWDLGFTEGYHTQPVVAGDTVAAITRVLAAEPGPEGSHAGVLTLQLIGVKNVSAAKAVQQYGADLFVKENDKKDRGMEKIPAKVFEIERQVLVKKRQ